MPSRNRIKTYVSQSFYHAYNRGVEKRIIFQDDQDYRVFLHLLKRCLSPSLKKAELHPLTEITGFTLKRSRPFQSLCGETELVAYVLMPNHFHLLIRQIAQDGMTRLLQKICMMYVRYFNIKYHRVGRLFQEVYKAVLIRKDAHLLHLTRYFHRTNPEEIIGFNQEALRAFPYSSYAYYLGKKRADWIYPHYVLECFPKDTIGAYMNFVENDEGNASKHLEAMAGLLLEDQAV